jgi:acetylornithine deacetylase
MNSHLVDLARRLVAFDTTSARTNVPLIEFVAERLDSIGFRVARQSWTSGGVDKANLVAVAGPAEPDGLIVSGHTDTVPFADQPGWTREPLALEIEDERVYGRGTTDMKVFIAQAIEAARTIGVANLARPLVFVFTADEEIGCLGAERLEPELIGLLGDVPLPKLCWIGEPTGWEMYHAHKSYAVFDVRIRGRGGHSGLPDAGVSAIGAAGAVLSEIGRYQQELRAEPSSTFGAVFPDAPFTTVNVATIQGGSAANMIADACTIRLSTRSLPDVDPLAAYRELSRRLRALDARDPATRSGSAEVSLSEPLAVPAFHAPRDTLLERALMAELGERDVRGALLGADGCRWQSLGIASLICGPGDFGEAHQPNESLSRRAFESGAAVIAAVVRRLLLQR